MGRWRLCIYGKCPVPVSPRQGLKSSEIKGSQTFVNRGQGKPGIMTYPACLLGLKTFGPRGGAKLGIMVHPACLLGPLAFGTRGGAKPGHGYLFHLTPLISNTV